MPVERLQNFINGEWVDAKTDKYVEIINPALDTLLCEAPMSFFPFGGRKDSFFGIVHGQGRDVIRFLTEPKIVIERWC